MGRFAYDAERGLMLPRERRIEPLRNRRLMGAPQQALLGAGSAAATDPNFSSVKLLLDASNLANNSTVFTDYSNVGRALTTVGGAKASTTGPKFNTSSAAFDGANDSITGVNSADFDFAAGDWTIEAWIFPTTVTKFNFIYSNRAETGSDNGIIFYVSATGVLTGTAWNNGTASNTPTISSVPINTWSHVMICRSGSFAYMGLAGTVTSAAWSLSIGASNGKLYVASSSNEGPNFLRDFQGRMDQVRVTKGVGRYTANFTPATAPFPHS